MAIVMQPDGFGERIELGDGYIMIITECRRKIQTGFGMKAYPFWYNLQGIVISELVLQDDNFLSNAGARLSQFIKTKMESAQSYKITFEEEVNRISRLEFEIRGFITDGNCRLFKEEKPEMVKQDKFLRKLMME